MMNLFRCKIIKFLKILSCHLVFFFVWRFFVVLHSSSSRAKLVRWRPICVYLFFEREVVFSGDLCVYTLVMKRERGYPWFISSQVCTAHSGALLRWIEFSMIWAESCVSVFSVGMLVAWKYGLRTPDLYLDRELREEFRFSILAMSDSKSCINSAFLTL